MRKIAILGAGGHARSTLDVLLACAGQRREMTCVGFIIDPEFAGPTAELDGLPVFVGFDWLTGHLAEVEVIGGIGAPEQRQGIVRRAAELGARFATLVHPRSTIEPRVTLGCGVVVSAGAVVSNHAVIGDHVSIGHNCVIGHDAVLRDCVSIYPGAILSGYVDVGAGALVGAGAVVVERVTLGEWSRIGAGATVLENVAPNLTVVGCPSRIVRSRPAGWQLATQQEGR